MADDKAPLISPSNAASYVTADDKEKGSHRYDGSVPETNKSVPPHSDLPSENSAFDPVSKVPPVSNQTNLPSSNSADGTNSPVPDPHSKNPPEETTSSSDGESADQNTSFLGRFINKLSIPKLHTRSPSESQDDGSVEKNKSQKETDPLVGEQRMESEKYTPEKDPKSLEDVKGDESEKDGDGNNFFVYYLSCFATIGGLLFGYDTGIISGAMLLIEDYFDLSTIWKEIIVSGTVGAAAVFALISGFTCDFLGRKITIMIASVVFAAGAVIMGIADSKEVLLAGRIVVGSGIGFASMTVPVYVAEAAPPAIRGRLVSLNQLFITIGILLSSIIAGAFHYMKETGWRYMLGLAVIPGVIQFLGFFYLPESPRWLVTKGKIEKATKVLQRIRGKKDVHEEIEDIQTAVEEEKKQKGFVLSKMLTTPHVRKALFVGCGLQVFQQLTGINTVIYYSATILRMAGFSSSEAIWLVLVPNSINFLATFIGLWLVERTGRKKLLAGSFAGAVLALVVLASGFQLSANFSPDIDRNVTETFSNGSLLVDKCYTGGYSSCESCIENDDCGYCYLGEHSEGSCLMAAEDTNDKDEQSRHGRCNKTNLDLLGTHWAHGYCPTDYTWMAVLGMALFVLAFAPGLGPVPWTVNSEIYPLWARSTGNALATACNWFCNLFVALCFLTLAETITKYGTFWLFASICFMGLLFTLIFLPETKNKTLEEVEKLFMGAPSKIDYLDNEKDSKHAKTENTDL